MASCFSCGYQLSSTLEERFCPKCGQNLSDRTTINRKDSFNISNTGGDVFGFGNTGSGNIIGKNIVSGSGTINVSKQELAKVDSQYANALQQFSDIINQQLKGRQISEDKVKSINNDLTDSGKEVEGIKPGEEDKVDQIKKLQVELKTTSVVQKILDVLPESAEAIAEFTPLAPFSKIIGKTMRKIVDAVSKR